MKKLSRFFFSTYILFEYLSIFIYCICGNIYHNLAQQAYDGEKNDNEKSLNDTKLKVFCFVLTQYIHTPLLRNSLSFGKRPIECVNLTIHNCATNQPFDYMWHEGIAKRSENEIASCVFTHLLLLNANVNHIIFYSDCCPDQNKNSFMATRKQCKHYRS